MPTLVTVPPPTAAKSHETGPELLLNEPLHLQQHVSDRREVQPQLIAPQVVRAGAVREQHQLFFNPILHVSSGAVVLFIQLLRWPCFSTQRRHHEPRVFSLLQMLGLGHYPSRTAPTLLRLIGEFFEQPGGAAGLLVLGFRLSHLLRDSRLQTFVFRQTQQIVHAFRLTPSHPLLAAKSGNLPSVSTDTFPLAPSETLSQKAIKGDLPAQALQVRLFHLRPR